jgi:tRNA (cytidine/uridine-2'-O-)-methyltransferase
LTYFKLLAEINFVMMNIVLFEPEIPPNTGNIMRLAANTGFQLHLIEPLGFELEDKLLRRAGLDYRQWADIKSYENYQEFLNSCEFNNLYAFTTGARRTYSEAAFSPGDALMFGPETRGLPAEILDSLAGDNKLRIPMMPTSRSLNLSNTVSIAVYEAWRQQGFGDRN